MNVFKHIYFWVDERLEMHDIIKKDFLDKPIPKGLNLSFCFGGITFFLFVMLAVTGYFMTLYYVPSPEQAYDAVDYLTFEVPMGQVIRGVHHWSGNKSLCLRCLQETARNQLDQRCMSVLPRDGFRFYRIPVALGSESLLGN